MSHAPRTNPTPRPVLTRPRSGLKTSVAAGKVSSQILTAMRSVDSEIQRLLRHWPSLPEHVALHQAEQVKAALRGITPQKPALTFGDHSVTLDQRRCELGNTALWRCIKVLVNAAGQPVEHSEMLRLIGADSIVSGLNDVRTTVYRLKHRLRQAGMSTVADCIQNVRGAYCFRASEDFTLCATYTPDGHGFNSCEVGITAWGRRVGYPLPPSDIITKGENT
jgi:hypothetical protein